MTTKINLMKLYLWFVSSILFIATCISLWMFINSAANKIIISDEEYVSWPYNREIKECSRKEYSVSWVIKESVKTKEEIKECEEKAKKEVVMRRNYDFKITSITSTIWFVLFAILFSIHYIKFRKKEKIEK